MKDIITKKKSSSSLMLFTNKTTKTELIKSLQHFALIVKFYTNLILTQNVVNFLRYIWPYWSFPMKDIITKKTLQVRRCHLKNLTTKTELVKTLQHFSLNVKMYKIVISTQNVVNF